MRRGMLVIMAIGSGVFAFCALLMHVGAELSRVPVSQTEMPNFHVTTETVYEDATIQFPCAVTGTDLILERTASYEGAFLEDSSGCEVVNITAAFLRNTGAKGIVKAKVVLEQGNRTLIFEVETIPPGQTVIVLEQNKSEYSQKPYSGCYGTQQTVKTLWWAKNAPKIRPVGMNTLSVSNPTQNILENIWIYYKNYEQELSSYLGGITYKVGIRKLEPGQVLEISPPFYVNGYSRIARVIVKEKKDSFLSFFLCLLSI